MDYSDNAIVLHLRDSEKIDPIKIIEAVRSRYARHIQDNIDTVRDYDNISKRKSFLKKEEDEYKFVFDALKDLLDGGTFRTSIGQLANSSQKNNQPKIMVPLYIVSSSIKSLFLVDVYINHITRKKLIIDELELNLHSDSQVKFVRLIARLGECRGKNPLAAHSDYIVQEINNLVSMKGVGDGGNELLDRYGFFEQDIFYLLKFALIARTLQTGFLK